MFHWDHKLVHHEAAPTDDMRYANDGYAVGIPPCVSYFASGTWVHCVNSFATAGGFDAIEERLRAQSDAFRGAPDAPCNVDALTEAAVFATCLKQCVVEKQRTRPLIISYPPPPPPPPAPRIKLVATPAWARPLAC